ncbi:cytochrome P450 [Nocardiopsis sediminis]|uniref:Cytochrome P450 n=1 Tax=Nocardiopsis sediminis TaxID=1778267 RepID=A0ABV8FMM2_9ACTN
MTTDSELPRFPFCPRGDVLHAQYRELQEHRPITRVLTPAGDQAWLITGHDLAVRAFDDDRLSLVWGAVLDSAEQGAAGPAPNAAASAQAAHKTGPRREFLGAIAPPRVEALRPRARATARTLLDAVADSRQPADLFPTYAQALPLALTCLVLGMPLDEAHGLIDSIETAMPIREDPQVDYGANWTRMHDYFVSFLARPDLPDGAARRSRDTNAARPPDERLDDDVLAEILAWFFGASHVGAVSVLAHSIVSLLDQRTAWDRLCEQGAAPRPAVEELLRHSLFLHNGLPRVATADIELGGVTIRAGDRVLISADTANRDPAAFPDPHRIDLTRNGGAHLAFGRGTYYCPGSALGRMGLQVAVEELTRRFPTMRLAVPPGEIEWRDDLLDRRPVAIPVTW